jgi:ubiquinone/menaquinone biosynthesis C-methylase UbiE
LKNRLIKRLMRLRERVPPVDDYHLNEIFRQKAFTEATLEERHRIMSESSRRAYQHEVENPFDAFFGRDLHPLLRDSTTLDLGCFTGGRAVAWSERYGMKKVHGVDISPVYIEAATRFAQAKGVEAEFVHARGERLPFDDAVFDAILSFDVFEHVQDVKQVLLECRRVLRPGGKLYAVFPSFLHPAEHHMSLVTLTPFIHYFFKGRDLIRAYNEILDERGEEAVYWYRRPCRELEPWERLETINGTTKRKFRRLMRETNWKVFHEFKPPMATALAQRRPVLKPVVLVAQGLGQLPIFEEFLSGRIVFILEKP